MVPYYSNVSLLSRTINTLCWNCFLGRLVCVTVTAALEGDDSPWGAVTELSHGLCLFCLAAYHIEAEQRLLDLKDVCILWEYIMRVETFLFGLVFQVGGKSIAHFS